MSVNGTPQGRPQMTAMPLIAPTSIGPAPLPIELAAVEGRNSTTGETVILIQVVTPAGVLIGFITQQMAKAYGELLQSLGTGIVLARGGLQ